MRGLALGILATLDTEAREGRLSHLYHSAESGEVPAFLGDWAQLLNALLAAHEFLQSREVRLQEEVFKRPDVLRWVEGLQSALLATEVVGKSSSLADLVKTVHRSLLGDRDEEFRIPDTTLAVGQTIAAFQNSHRPGDLWHFVTPDYRQASLWVQLKSGDNLDMAKVAAAVAAHLEAAPPPEGLEAAWFGLTWINVVWQEKMVAGMLAALLGSFVVVYLIMALLFRSALWGLLAMVPLSLTIGLIYGVIGLIGKDYDMPVAVLSSLTLGLAVDFAIHLLARARALVAKHGSWEQAQVELFGEPFRAVWRNVAVLGVGFLPLLLSPLMPYRTVGVLLAAIMGISGLATLILLPALIQVLRRRLFPEVLK
ncbi:MMPL family transporter [bacterium]|nr:MMPL family transporter [bacterium]